jgi:hypothetical protein
MRIFTPFFSMLTTFLFFVKHTFSPHWLMRQNANKNMKKEVTFSNLNVFAQSTLKPKIHDTKYFSGRLIAVKSFTFTLPSPPLECWLIDSLNKLFWRNAFL